MGLEMEQAVLAIPARSVERTQGFKKHVLGNFLYKSIRRVDHCALHTLPVKQYEYHREKPHYEKALGELGHCWPILP